MKSLVLILVLTGKTDTDVLVRESLTEVHSRNPQEVVVVIVSRTVIKKITVLDVAYHLLMVKATMNR